MQSALHLVPVEPRHVDRRKLAADCTDLILKYLRGVLDPLGTADKNRVLLAVHAAVAAQLEALENDVSNPDT